MLKKKCQMFQAKCKILYTHMKFSLFILLCTYCIIQEEIEGHF